MEITKDGIRIKLSWDSGSEDDIEKAMNFFTKLTRQGWLAARRDDEFRRVLDFDPDYEELWFIPISEGG